MTYEVRNRGIFSGIDNILNNIDSVSHVKNTDNKFNKTYENRVLQSLKDIENGKGITVHNKKEDDDFWNSL